MAQKISSFKSNNSPLGGISGPPKPSILILKSIKYDWLSPYTGYETLPQNRLVDFFARSEALRFASKLETAKFGISR